MKKSRDDVLVGLVLVVGFVIAIVGSVWLARGGLSKGYPLYANFTWGSGLKTGAPVWVSGADVGYVAGVQFRPDGTLQTELRITSDQPIPKGSPATVVPNGLFGDVAVNFTPQHATERYQSGDTVISGKAAPGIAALTGKADSITTSINALTQELNKELVAGGGIADLRQTIAGTNKLVAQLTSIAAEQSRQLTMTMESLRRTTSAIDSAKIDSTLVNLRAASANVATLTRTLDSTSRALQELMKGLEEGQGTAGKLLKDPGAYDDVRHLLARVDSILVDLQKNPKKYLKFSVF
jgi:phospholipid/cholesterol/gamma-HCH transport system substrate-binding protein